MTSPLARPTRRSFVAAGAAAALAGLTGGAAAQSKWPDRPVRFIVPFASGISADIVARMLADPLSRALAQPVVVDNRAGASGMIGTEIGAKSAPDGNTLLLSVDSIIGVLPHLYKKLGYRPLEDLQPVTQVTRVPWIVVVGADQPYDSLPALLAAARARPGTLDYGSLGPGSGSHMRMEMICGMAGVRMSHVPYKGSPLADVLAGQIPLSIEPSTTAIPLIKSGKLKALGITSAQRSAALPQVPTIGETLAGYEADGWHGVFLPTGVAPAIVDRYQRELTQIIRSQAFVQQLQELGVQAVGDSLASFTAVTRAEYAKWGQIVKANNIQIE